MPGVGKMCKFLLILIRNEKRYVYVFNWHYIWTSKSNKRKYNISVSYVYCHPSSSNPRGVLLNLRLSLNRVIMKPLLSLYVISAIFTCQISL